MTRAEEADEILEGYVKGKDTMKEQLVKAIQETQANLYECNNIISDYIDIVRQKDKLINEMAEQLAGIAIWDNKKDEPLVLISKEEVIEYYEERCK